LGVVVYTGHDSKIMKNRNQTPHKKSQLDELTNKYIYLMFGIEILFCLISITAMTILNVIQGQTRWYLSFSTFELS
jgi:phospholipid-transporting ATPase